jgi:hypothetical protein
MVVRSRKVPAVARAADEAVRARRPTVSTAARNRGTIRPSIIDVRLNVVRRILSIAEVRRHVFVLADPINQVGALFPVDPDVGDFRRSVSILRNAGPAAAARPEEEQQAPRHQHERRPNSKLISHGQAHALSLTRPPAVVKRGRRRWPARAWTWRRRRNTIPPGIDGTAP